MKITPFSSGDKVRADAKVNGCFCCQVKSPMVKG